MKRRILSFFLSLLLVTALIPSVQAAAAFSDVPANSWAAESIEKAVAYGLMNGMGDGTFGYGATIRRSEFITLLVRLFDWELPAETSSPFTDSPSDAWYTPYLSSAVEHGVLDAGGVFCPSEAIQRKDMAIFFIRALGYQNLAERAAGYTCPFTDVTADTGYITLAYDLGLVNGMSASTFAPAATATREQAAAMLVRTYEKYYHETDFLHGFYAISSYSQLGLTAGMDAVSAGWSRMTLDGTGTPLLRTTSAQGNEFYVPSGYSSVTDRLEQQGTPLHLSVYMDTAATSPLSGGSALYDLLADPVRRSQAVEAILLEVTTPYRAIGHNPYAGVTIDFEGLKGEAAREQFTAFLQELSAALHTQDKALYVTVQPALYTGEYYNGYDYRAIGEAADKVILMAHDYSPTTLYGFEGTAYYQNAALTPLDQVYHSLRAATDPETGVADRSKLVLAISCAAMAWKLDENDRLQSPLPLRPGTDTVHLRLQQADTEMGWSDTYRNPYLRYTTETGERIFLWYEDGRSAEEKVQLAKLFGVSGISIWRLGQIPAYEDVPHYDLLDAVG